MIQGPRAAKRRSAGSPIALAGLQATGVLETLHKVCFRSVAAEVVAKTGQIFNVKRLSTFGLASVARAHPKVTCGSFEIL